MSRFVILCCVLYIWINISILSANGQTDAPLSVSFAGQNTHYVATLDEATGEWRVVDLGADVLQGRIDIHRIQPVWSPDGRFLFYNRITDNQEDNFSFVASEIMRYDTVDDDLISIIEPFTPDDVSYIAEAVQFGDFSPDGRYLWAYRVVAQQQSYLLDLQNNSIIFSADGWYETIDWQMGLFRTTMATSLFPDIALAPSIVDINLPTGDIIHQQTYPLENTWLWRSVFYLLDTEQLLVEAHDDTLRLVDWRTEASTVIADGSQLQAHTDENGTLSFVYQQDDKVFVLNLSSMASTQVSTDEMSIVRWEFNDDGLVIVEQQENQDGTMRVDWVQVAGDDERTTTTVYAGDSTQVAHASLRMPIIVLREQLFDDANRVRWQIHTASELLFEATFDREQRAIMTTYHDRFVSLNAFSDTSPEEIVTYALIDLHTETVYMPPEPNLRVITVAPDSSWILYGRSVPDFYNTGFVAGVFAYQPETNTLIEIISEEEHFIIFDDHHQNFIWSR
ncbi:MAG: hypothetical protein AAFV98_09180 [Chloroflexota bacterium]